MSHSRHRLARHYDRLARHGPYATLAPGNRGGRKSEYVAAVFDAAILPLLQAGAVGTLLDFGCGTGTFTRLAAQRAGYVCGMDISPGMLAMAQTLCAPSGNVGLLRGDGQRLALGDRSLDVVVSREVLCYEAEQQLAVILDDIFRVLRPGGCFLWLEQAATDPHWQRHPASPAVHRRAPERLRELAEAAGFEVEGLRKLRNPRWPLIYPIWFGLVPRRLFPTLARFELAWHKGRPCRGRRWFDCLLILRRPA